MMRRGNTPDLENMVAGGNAALDQEGLERVIGPRSVFQRVIDYFKGGPSDMTQYAFERLPKDVREKLFAGKTRQQQEQILAQLRAAVEKSSTKYEAILNKASLKFGGKGAGVAAIFNDAYHMLRGSPLNAFSFLQYGIIGAKTLLEAPAMYSYWKETHDPVGMAKWLGYKAVAAAVPILGPLLDYGTTGRIIKSRIAGEAVKEFLQEQGLYKAQPSLGERVRKHVGDVTGKLLPEGGAYQPAYAY